MQQAAFQDFLAQNAIYPGNLQPQKSTAHPHNNYCYQTPSLTRAQLYQDYPHFEKPNKTQKGKSLGSAFPRRASDYVDFSNMMNRLEKYDKRSTEKCEKQNCSKPQISNFSCIQEAGGSGSRTAASCENLSSQAWNFAEQGTACAHSKKKKSKFFPKLIPKFFKKRNKSKHEQETDDFFIAHQPNFSEFGRARSRTINCDSLEQL